MCSPSFLASYVSHSGPAARRAPTQARVGGAERPKSTENRAGASTASSASELAPGSGKRGALDGAGKRAVVVTAVAVTKKRPTTPSDAPTSEGLGTTRGPFCATDFRGFVDPVVIKSFGCAIAATQGV